MDLAANQASPWHSTLLNDISVAGLGLSPVRNIAREREVLARRRYGRIVTQAGKFHCVSGRWWPHIGNLMQVYWDIALRRTPENRCELFYHQPFGSPNFLTLSYVHSGAATSLSTFYLATLVLDEIARLKKTDAIVCNVTNDRLTDRLLSRWGWQSHMPDWPGRHFIKRFYGTYPEIPAIWRQRFEATT